MLLIKAVVDVSLCSDDMVLIHFELVDFFGVMLDGVGVFPGTGGDGCELLSDGGEL